ncbi:MAG TPA: hypothetical protein VMU18_03725 [Rhodoblastus sp.]|nr:hypothetical protein [Rhodoblastus sp.]
MAAPVSALASVPTCGPLEQIFGVCNLVSAPARHAPRLRHFVHRKAVHKKQPSDLAVAAGGSRGQRQAPLPPPPGASFASIEHFAADPTLRSGDIVVTPHGFLVYHEGGRNFTSLDGKKSALAALERASRAPDAAKWEASHSTVSRPDEGRQQPEYLGGIRTISLRAPAR